MPVSSAFFRCSAHPQGIGTNRFITILQPCRNWCGERNSTTPRGNRLPRQGRRISELISRRHGELVTRGRTHCAVLLSRASIIFEAVTCLCPRTADGR